MQEFLWEFSQDQHLWKGMKKVEVNEGGEKKGRNRDWADGEGGQ